MADISSWNLSDIKLDAVKANRECSQRGLSQSAKWAAEIMYALDHVSVSKTDLLKFSSESSENEVVEYDRYTLAKSYFDLQEYDRAAHFSKSCTSSKAYFIHIYSRYLAGEKRKVDDAVDSVGSQDRLSDKHLRALRVELSRRHKAGELDGYCLYIYGVVLKKLDLTDHEAVNVLVEAVNAEPLHWGAWLELSLLVTDREMLNNLSVPDHWINYFFIAQAYLELQLNDDALRCYQQLLGSHFSCSTYVMSQLALSHHNLREVDYAVNVFSKLQQVDPCRLDNMDTYSNLLYVKEMKAELAYLAHRCSELDKYRVETCCIIGNYYSLRSQHDKAVLYFQRALKLNPNYLSAWTLMGHEYMELKHTSAAIQAYRQAIEVNRRDYRAWYGLGQTYEILKMPYYCLYYYKQAQMLRPNDSRMVVALGEAYDRLDRLQEAKKCFWKAHSLGDMEGIALVKLAKLYEKLLEEEQAAAAYMEYLYEVTNNNMIGNMEEQAHAYKYLANYHLKMNNVEEAYIAAQKSTEYNETREEGKALLRQISRLRALHGSDMGIQQCVDMDSGAVTVATDRTQTHREVHATPQNTRISPMYLTFTP